MTHQQGDNAANTSRPALYNGAAEWEAFDKLPAEIRKTLVEAPFDYSPTEVYEFWFAAMQEERSYGSFESMLRGDAASATQQTLETIRGISQSDLEPYWKMLGRRFPWSNARFDKTRQTFRRPLTP